MQEAILKIRPVGLSRINGREGDVQQVDHGPRIVEQMDRHAVMVQPTILPIVHITA